MCLEIGKETAAVSAARAETYMHETCLLTCSMIVFVICHLTFRSILISLDQGLPDLLPIPDDVMELAKLLMRCVNALIQAH